MRTSPLFPCAMLLCVVCFLSLNAWAQPPGLYPALGTSPMDPFLRQNPRHASFFPQRQVFVTPTATLIESDTGRHLMVYQDLGGAFYGLPVIMPLEDFARYKFQRDAKRIADARLGDKVQAHETGDGLLNVDIPIRVPRGLSAITGEGNTNLSITGRRRIELSGLSQYTEGQAQSTIGRTSKFPTINFEQESQLNVTGTIGDRITVELQQNSQSNFDLGESLRLQYRGDEDGIIEIIEAGNTSLSLPGTRLIGFSAQGRGGLFGIKTRGRIGAVNFTVVTSQDKASSNRKTFQGQSEESALIIRDYDYLEDTYFFLDQSYRENFRNGVAPSANNRVNVQSVRLFLNDYNPLNDIELSAISGIAYAFWQNGQPDISGSQQFEKGVEEGSFHELDPSQFTVFPEGFIIHELGRINAGFTLAVAYQTQDGRNVGDVNYNRGTAGGQDIRLKLLKARQQTPSDPTWNLAWRNVYSLGGRRIPPDGLQVNIFREVPGQTPTDNQNGLPYLQLFGLDTHTNGLSASSSPDGLIDIDGGNNIPGVSLERGHLIFPFLEPFGESGLGAPDLQEDARVPRIYTESNRAARVDAGRYGLAVRSASRSSEISLGLGIVENSEIIRLNNRTLERGKDYTIDYTFGRLRFIGEAEQAVSDPTADLAIDYNTTDLFGFGQSKSLVGMRLERPFADQYSLVGLTLLYGNQTTPSQRVRVGQEPARTVIWDANARLRFKPQLLTDFVSAIPLVNAQTPSTIDLDFEIAQSLPNPNTKGVAYIDDFEGASNSLSFQIGKLLWSQASRPTRQGTPITLPRARLTWYNPIDRDREALTRIQPNRDDITIDQNIVDMMVLRFDPARGTEEPVHLSYDTNRPPRLSWAGVMRYVSGFDLSRSKYLELWVRGNAGKLHIDLGEISERIELPLDHPVHNDPGNRERYPFGYRSEDTPLGNLPTGDGVSTPEEDIGLNRLTDVQEREIFQKIWPGLQVPDDPAGDNWRDINRTATSARERYPIGLNGTQGNNAERSSRPDTEDLNGNGLLDARNSYVRYSVDMATNLGFNPTANAYTGIELVVPGTQSDLYPELGGATDPPWRLLRIPLKGKDAPRTFEGSPDTAFARVIDFARVWIEHSDTTTIQIYTIDAVGSDWLENPGPAAQQSGDFQVATIGTSNSFYTSPPGLERDVDPATGVRRPENSLVLNFVDLYPGETVSASRNFIQGEDYTRYGALTMFVHGGNPASDTYISNFPAAEDTLSQGASQIELFVRFAPISEDTLNFYEYRSRVYRGWAENANTMRINLDLMSQIKGQLLDLQISPQQTDSISISLQQGTFTAFYDRENSRIKAVINGGVYIVRGNPALSQIRAFTIGVRNLGDRILSDTNEIWVNELRVDNIRKKNAFSALVDMRTTLSDLGNITMNLERRSGDFQDLQGTASGQTTTRFNFDTRLNLEKFLPEQWNASIPIQYSYNQYHSVPRIRPGSDIVLTPDQKANESDVRSQTRFNISMRKRPAQENPRLLSRLFFDKVNTSLNYSSDASTTGAITQRRTVENENLNGTFSYNQTWSQRNGLPVFKWVPLFRPLNEAQFFYFPSSINYNLRFNRGLSDQLQFRAIAGDTSNVIATRTEDFTLSENFGLQYSPFRSLSTDYSLGFNRDLRNGFAMSQLQFGRETSRNQTINVRYTPNFSRWLSISPSYTASYNDQQETGGQRTEYGNIRRGLTANAQNTSQARVNFNLPSLFQKWARRPAGESGFSIVHLIGQTGSALQNVQASVSRTKAYNVYGLTGRPSLAYQFGLTDTTDIPAINVGSGTRVDTRSIRDQAQASTGIRLPLNIQVSTSINYSQAEQIGATRTNEDQVTFPKIDANWRGLENMPVLGWLWISSNAGAGYQESHTRRGEGGLTDLTLTNDAREKSFNPLFQWTARWKGQINTNLRTSRSRRNEIRYQRNVTADTASAQPTLADRLIGTTLTYQNQLQTDLRYSLQGRFQRSLDLTLGFQQSEDRQIELPRTNATDEPAEPIVRQNNTSWSVSLGSQYAFSSRFTGGMNFRHERRKDVLRDLTSISWDFRLWGEIGFQ